MATVFRRGKRWVAKVKLWRASSSAFEWVQRALPAGIDEVGALRMADELERVSEIGKAGIDPGQVETLVRYVLGLAGVGVAGAPGTLVFAREYVGGKTLTDKSLTQYNGFVSRMESWLKKDIPLDAWDIGGWKRFYASLLKSVSARRANEHIAFWRGVCGRAQKLGLVRSNLPGALELRGAASEGKEPILRADMALLLWSLRKMKLRPLRRAWLGLALLGWHTGHRIADLLAVDRASFELRDGLGWLLRLRPGKKRGIGGREVFLPVPGYLPGLCAVGFGVLNGGRGNYNGKISAEFVSFLELAGVKVGRRKNTARETTTKSFHSFRHGMASRLAAAGVAPEVARLVTDHDSPHVHRGYVHTEIQAVAGALRAVRRK